MSNFSSIPKHIAVIMDGNGRWAEKRGLSRAEGHAQGVETLRNVLEFCKEYGIDYLTAYAFSTENWRRPKQEVDALMSLLVDYLKVETEKLMQEKIKLRIIGEVSALPEQVQTEIKNSVNVLNIPEHKRVLTLALSYGGRNEIIRATKSMISDVLNGKLCVENIDEERFSSYLDTDGIPDPDLMIRTAGELRLSNFLLWQLSYAELYATDKTWPDFSREEFVRALGDYDKRTRKFGSIQ